MGFVSFIALLGGASRHSVFVPMELCYDLDCANDVLVELCKVFRRHPVLKMRRPADLPYLKPAQVLRVNFKLRHEALESRLRILGVPVTRNLLSILSVEHRIENG